MSAIGPDDLRLRSIMKDSELMIAAARLVDAKVAFRAKSSAGLIWPDTDPELVELGRAEGALVDAVKAWREW